MSEPGVKILPPVTTAPAPMMERAPISAQSRTMAPMPTRTSSAMLQAWITALWPTVTSSPISVPQS